MIVATIWYTLREIDRADEAMEAEYARSEQLLANILPATIAARLKDPSRTVIADKYDDASILFADIAGYTALTEAHGDEQAADLVAEFFEAVNEELPVWGRDARQDDRGRAHAPHP